MSVAESTNLSKIRTLAELAELTTALRAQGKQVVHCHGVFDLLHVGHLRHFEAARRFGDVLIVTLTPDRWVNKGPLRPAFDEQLRLEMLSGLNCVDYVALNEWPTAVETLRLVKPDVFVKGSEFTDRAKDLTGAIAEEEAAVRSIGGRLEFTDDVTFSSSHLINRYLPQISKEASEFVERFQAKYTFDDVAAYLEGAKKLRVLVIGESIIDEYNYCEALGKSGKEPILAVKELSTERFAGGALAVANHLAEFTDQVGLASMLGKHDGCEAFVREKLNAKVAASFLYMAGAPTIVKKRFIESYPFQKMFEVYRMGEDQDAAANSERLFSMLRDTLPRYDLVVVSDYGHGMLDERTVELLSREAKCLALHAQANAGNFGFNTVAKYPRADFICVSEKEIRLEARQRQKDLYRIVEQAAEKLGARRALITRGRQGVLCWGRDEGFSIAPALAGHFNDRLSAGDAVLAVSSLCVPQGAPAEMMGLICNAVGAMAVETVGNRAPIERTPLLRFLCSLFK
ncbi:MAG: adenylyltransferase/cytidyltransferase family protein [Planctomycetia bacterium]|nr:adenylyltransferase/cytidyltransferase family protein [Planctomycetia bacterium]